MKLYKPENHSFTIASPGAANKILHADGMTLAIWKMDKGTELAQHSHKHEQIACVMRGAIEFQLESGKVLVKAGEMIVFASNEVHGGFAIEDSIVHDVFTPARDDFKEKFPCMKAEN